ncbi:hypothetical protein CkaCkLH20_02273 [Colletotrichum karsti]|uniref:Uncharacterized protein n=1 Tax=Colletotrichum karsti TaxID=1095194 RepID=A0A9P6LLD4_9PEZI|nr:uncharacterized protein CkaCkLH20_02273 [Colletotrichum karsti]KAF9880319.1 hypothetical protein CkaCkLH20_02273 [Colletotrichum karsti]
MRDNVIKCLDAFRDLSGSLVSPSDGISDYGDIDDNEKVRTVESRFKEWSGVFMAHRFVRNSLEYRLRVRDASLLRKDVVRLLKDLADSIAEAMCVTNGVMPPLDDEAGDDSDSDDPDDDGNEGDDREICDSDQGEFAYDAVEMSRAIAVITENVESLFRLLTTFDNPSSHDESVESGSTDSSHYEQFFMQHVREKFPLASDSVVDRLGKALSQRRRYFKYRESHQQTSAQCLEGHEPGVAYASLEARAAFGDGDGVLCHNFREGNRSAVAVGIEALRKVPMKPMNGAGPANCGRVSCQNNTGIWWCNDATTPRELNSFADIADGAQRVVSSCKDKLDANQGDGMTVSGQAFHKDGWNVVVRGGDDCANAGVNINM